MIFSAINFIKNLTAIGDRQGQNEVKAAKFIEETLKKHKVTFKIQKFKTSVPISKKAELKADKKKIPCLANCFESGTISDKSNLVSSISDLDNNHSSYNLNFNPHCEVISRADHYFNPALAIKASDLQKILTAKKIEGVVEVQKYTYTSKNFLIGNTLNPKTILFCHYDSLGPGAVDNASGTAVLMEIAINHADFLNQNLLVIAGNEEIAYDKNCYWGFGYRAFEKKYEQQMEKCDKLIVVDCVGNAKTTIEQNLKIVNLGFPIKNLKKWAKKSYMIYGSLEKLMEVYHSDASTYEKINEKYLHESLTETLKLASKPSSLSSRIIRKLKALTT